MYQGLPSNQQLFLQQQHQQLYARTLSQASQLQHQQKMMHHLMASYANTQYSYQTLGTRKSHSRAHKQASAVSNSRPFSRCRVMYMGSSVPHVTKNGLHGIQEPLHHLYPEERFSGSPSAQQQLSASKTPADQLSNQQQQTIDISHLSSGLGIDSWLSVWSNGLLLENTDDLGRQVRGFFSIESLHYCAAVRFFDTSQLEPSSDTNLSAGARPPPSDHNNNSLPAAPANTAEPRGRFLPLDAPIFRWPSMLDANHPPVFAVIFRRTSGVKVLECHAFICRRDAAANALVRSCTHAYGDLLNARRLSIEMPTPVTGPAAPVQRCSSPASHLSHSRLETPVSEDNYAVISQTRASGSPGPIQKQTPVERAADNSNRKGSSRSLFPDFSPEPVAIGEDLEISIRNTPVERLSQSMERLQMNGQQPTCCHMSEARQESEKRLSKSMQNLHQEKAVQYSSHKSISVPPKRSSRPRKRSQTSSIKLKRRAASVHELRCPPLSEVWPQIESPQIAQNRPPTDERLSSRLEPAAELGSTYQQSRRGAVFDKPSGNSARQERRQRRSKGPPLPPVPGQQQHQYLAAHQLYMRPHYPAQVPFALAMISSPAHALDPGLASLMLAQQPSTQLRHPLQPIYGPARFRCISPPAALVGPGQWTHASPMSPSQVASGEPGFIRTVTRHADKPKLSWIKRLSLTISAAGSSGSGLCEQNSSTGSQIVRPRRRRSSLFNITGTLSRRGHALASVAASTCKS